MNVTSFIIKDYENKPRFPAPGKQTQSNPMSKIKAGGAKIGFSIVEAVTVDVVDEKMVGQVYNLSVHLNTDSLFPKPRESAGIISVCTPVDVPFVLVYLLVIFRVHYGVLALCKRYPAKGIAVPYAAVQ